MKESEIQKQILDYLVAKRIFHHRQNSGAFDNGKGGFLSIWRAWRAGHRVRHRGAIRGYRGQSAEGKAERAPKGISAGARSGGSQVCVGLFAG